MCVVTTMCALTDIVLYSSFKQFIDFLPVWLLITQPDLVLEPI